MASESFSYDHPEYQVSRTFNYRAPATTASTTVVKFPVFAASRIKSVRGACVVAGTNATAGYDIFNGTTSVGQYVVGTNTAGVIPAAVQIAAATAGTCTDYIEIKTAANSATASYDLVIEYELLYGATVTV
jgi:hypothetical protein